MNSESVLRKLVSKFAIPRANGKYEVYNSLRESNRLALCEGRLIASSSR